MKRKHPDALREYAVRRVIDGEHLAKVSHDTKVDEATLYRWVAKARKEIKQ